MPDPVNTTAAPVAAKPVFGKNVLSVLAIIAGIILIVILILAFLVAKSGLVHVPFFSIFYHGPTPVRLVIKAPPIDPTAFRVMLSSRFLSQVAEGKKPPYIISLSEKELTGALESVMSTALRNQAWKVSAAQLAVEPSGLEFYGLFQNGALHVDLRVRFVPVVEKGSLRFEPKDVRFGDIPIDPGLARQIVGNIFARDFGTWTLSFGEATLRDVTLRQGVVQITASMPTP